jgi:hypothetical protein
VVRPEKSQSMWRVRIHNQLYPSQGSFVNGSSWEERLYGLSSTSRLDKLMKPGMRPSLWETDKRTQVVVLTV